MHLETFDLHGRRQLKGHSHQTLHLCIIQDGSWEERTGPTWRPCGPGTIRISPGHAGHHLQVQSTGAQGKIIELPRHTQKGLAKPLNQSVFLTRDPHNSTTLRLIHAWDTGDHFTAECAALQLAAAAVNPHPTEAPTWLTDLYAELNHRTTQPHSLNSLADRYNRHRAHVSRAFRTQYGRSIGAHLQAQRIAAAKKQLQTTDQPLVGLALDLGFADQAHFARVFRHHTGLPPSKFRSQAKKAA